METFSSHKKQQKKKILLTVFAVGAAGVLGYFGWQYYKKKKGQPSSSDFDAALAPAATDSAVAIRDTAATVVSRKSKAKPSAATSVSAAAPDTDSTAEFPLKKGSKGDKVRQLQEALLAKYGKSILPKYGADGGFGTETVNALKKAGLPSSISESTFNVLTAGVTTSSSNMGNDLYAAADAQDFTKALTLLKKMKSAQDYSAANEAFKTGRIGGVRQTIVNGLLSTFASKDQQEKIKFEFLRMGLQFDGSKWSLSGFDGLAIITTMPTTVWVNARQGVDVPARMVLGSEVARRLDYTLFANKGKYFLVPSRCIQYLQ
jgi:hypothetical protein